MNSNRINMWPKNDFSVKKDKFVNISVILVNISLLFSGRGDKICRRCNLYFQHCFIFRKVEKYKKEAGDEEREGDENDPGWTQVDVGSKLDNGWFIPTSKVEIFKYLF